jgi:hypothetical protein
MKQVRWKNQFPPMTPRSGYQVREALGEWRDESEVRAIRGFVLWVAE